MPTVVDNTSGLTSIKRSQLCWIWLTFALLTPLIGCAPENSAAHLQEYQTRLARTLDISIPSLPEALPLPYPTRHELLKHPTEIAIDLTELYKIQTCELGSLVAQRNTALGKVQAYSVRLHYEHTLLAALSQCIAFYQQSEVTSEESISLLPTLQHWQAIKQADLTVHWSNMLTLSEETKQAFSRPIPDLLVSPQLDITGQVAGLAQLNAYQTSGTSQAKKLENQLQQLAILRLPASVWLTQQQLALGLPVITKVLDSALPAQSCGSGRNDDTAAILRNVFYLFFIEKIQPVGGRINAFHYAFEQVSNEWQQHPDLPDAFKAYLQKQAQEFERYQQAMKAHINVWQTFLARCNMSPMA
ncbi:DUF3080 family protein [Aestuariibacter sp. GS-14]|uniref:DUF3080 family protein n=1 Tax=Aestuariibacter sp. GS-14 TaxID=2590670 RepID=UPI0015E843EF|nr:DUF3080 family protein [Aestuariibacter sp. GS-14]